MNFSIKLIFTISSMFLLMNCKGQVDSQEVANVSKETQAVESVMKSYKDALQNLTVEGTMQLFTKDAKVYESGGVEGTYKNYVDHHLGPELHHFNSFSFSDYNIHVDIDLPYAFTTETYIYTIDLKANPEKGRDARIIRKKGVATSVLKKVKGTWKIIKTHSSSRDIRGH